MLCCQPDDELHDLFAGSGAVTLATELTGIGFPAGCDVATSVGYADLRPRRLRDAGRTHGWNPEALSLALNTAGTDRPTLW